MKKGFRSFCNGVASTSTLKQGKLPDQFITTSGEGVSSCMLHTPSWLSSSYVEDTTTLQDHPTAPAPTLEEMVARLDMEEAAAKRAKAAARRWPGPMVGLPVEEEDEEEEVMATTIRRRMSCVNNSDILKSARNALNQYPRFSLDGKDALYRSSFQNRGLVSTKLMAGKQDPRLGLEMSTNKNGNNCCLMRPATLAGQTVVWCKPGIIPRLMGLESMPVPLFGPTSATKSKHNRCIGKLQKSECLKGRTCKQGTHGCGRTACPRHTGRPVHFDAVRQQGPDWHIGRIR